MCLAQGPQRSDAGKARTRGPSASSQALYHWATALPEFVEDMKFQLLIKAKCWKILSFLAIKLLVGVFLSSNSRQYYIMLPSIP